MITYLLLFAMSLSITLIFFTVYLWHYAKFGNRFVWYRSLMYWHRLRKPQIFWTSSKLELTVLQAIHLSLEKWSLCRIESMQECGKWVFFSSGVFKLRLRFLFSVKRNKCKKWLRCSTSWLSDLLRTHSIIRGFRGNQHIEEKTKCSQLCVLHTIEVFVLSEVTYCDK